MTKEIALTQGKVALVDDADYERLSQWRWYFFYAGYAMRIEIQGGKKRTIFMHRQIMNTPKRVLTDHINGNGLDNRRCNLRYANDSQNGTNSDRMVGVSGYRGVTWAKDKDKWKAQIRSNRKKIFLGYFCDEVEAAQAYDRAAIDLHGEFARCNFAGIP